MATDDILLNRQTVQTARPSLADLIAVYPIEGQTDPTVDDDTAALLASNNPPQMTTLQALADAMRPGPATTSGAGIVELATLEQARQGTDNSRAVTSLGLRTVVNAALTGDVDLSFTSFNDTPSALGNAGQFLRVNTARSSLEWSNAVLPTGAQIVNALTTLTGNARLPATAVRDLPAGSLVGLSDTPNAIGTTGQVLAVNSNSTGFEFVTVQSGGGGLASITSDTTLNGAGTVASPLSVANPISAAQLTKLDGIAAGAEVNVQADWNATSGDALILNKPAPQPVIDSIRVRNLLEGLNGNDRLPTGALRDYNPGATAFTGLSDTPGTLGSARQQVVVNAAGNALEFANPPLSISQSERNKLRDIPANAASAFTGLTDTPSALGTAGQVPVVNAAGNALEFGDVGGANVPAGNTFSGVTSTPFTIMLDADSWYIFMFRLSTLISSVDGTIAATLTFWTGGGNIGRQQFPLTVNLLTRTGVVNREREVYLSSQIQIRKVTATEFNIRALYGNAIYRYAKLS